MTKKPEIRKPFEKEYRISFKFGADPEWYTKVFGYPHNGIDFAMPKGTPVLACDKGNIIYADNTPDSNGCGVIIEHKWGRSLYWHLDEVSVRVGNEVSMGCKIGISGDTGFATGPHLHFGVAVVGQGAKGMRGWSDPKDYIKKDIEEPEPPVVDKKRYMVKPGDSLWKISQKVYGNGKYWPKIYEANKDKIKDPNIIHALQVLNIP